MADATAVAAGATSSASDCDKAQRKLGRQQLARLVVVGSFLTIFLLVLVILLVSQGNNATVTNMADRAFTTILPVLAGWVGTVLAFYFSAASLEATTSSLDKAINPPASTPTAAVADKMIPPPAIKGTIDLAKRAPGTIPLAELTSTYINLQISRLIFVENGTFRYVMHQSALNAFLVKKGDGTAQLTFADLLADAEALVQISKLVVFVKPSTALADARNALNAVAGAQDIIVTADATANTPMLGWLTNVDLTKFLAP